MWNVVQEMLAPIHLFATKPLELLGGYLPHSTTLI